MKTPKFPRPLLKWICLSVLSGILSGVAAAVFLILMDAATEIRNSHSYLIWFLPLSGLVIGWIYYRFGKDIAAGSNLIFEEIHDPRKIIPVSMAPFILLGTVLTHLFGGSAGREGTAVQMGASLSDQLSRYFKVEPQERKILLVAGAGAGFGAAIGAPWAGMVFGMEVIQIGGLRLFAVLECFISSFTAYYVTILLQAPHSIYVRPEMPSFRFSNLLWVAVAGILFGLVARAFSQCTHLVEKIHRKGIAYPPLRPFVAGLFLILFYAWEGSYRYVGLGIPIIQESLQKLSDFKDPSFKFIFTALTVASGFKGGEFIPLVFIGSTLGSALSQFIPLSLGLLSAVGFAAVFGGAANTPIACSLMAVEIFGYSIAPYAIVACFMSYFVSGKTGIYRGQRASEKKLSFFWKKKAPNK